MELSTPTVVCDGFSLAYKLINLKSTPEVLSKEDMDRLLSVDSVIVLQETRTDGSIVYEDVTLAEAQCADCFDLLKELNVETASVFHLLPGSKDNTDDKGFKDFVLSRLRSAVSKGAVLSALPALSPTSQTKRFLVPTNAMRIFQKAAEVATRKDVQDSVDKAAKEKEDRAAKEKGTQPSGKGSSNRPPNQPSLFDSWANGGLSQFRDSTSKRLTDLEEETSKRIRSADQVQYSLLCFPSFPMLCVLYSPSLHSSYFFLKKLCI